MTKTHQIKNETRNFTIPRLAKRKRKYPENPVDPV